MQFGFSRIDSLVTSALDKVFPAAQIQIRVGGEIVYDKCFGFLDPETRTQPTNASTRFDLASVSKLFTVVAFMTLVEEGRVGLDQPVHEVMSEFSGERAIAPYPDPLHPGRFVEVVPSTNKHTDASRVTFRQLLSHNAGLPAWLPLWRMALEWQRELPAEAVQRRLHEAVYATSFAYPPGARVVYSDIGLLLIGFAIESLTGQSLAEVVRERLTAPLGLRSITYGPIPCDNVAPTELYAHQGRRMCGEVHDENAFAFGGVAGHAGLFGNAHDVAAFGDALRQCLVGAKQRAVIESSIEQDPAALPLLHGTMTEMVRLQAQDGDVRRGLGFALRSPNPNAMSHPLSESAFGHLGFTGTSLWIDPARDLDFACLTNYIYYGREGEDTMTPFRVALSRAVVEAIPVHSSGFSPSSSPASGLVDGANLLA